ncbi:hypothetical protein [Puniceibacterium sediminis]|uniref:Uncharacterized protein n=1 Tax=Puniceibacterium sediminis TaxID=1608407 RepID=A0A238Y1F7_9RHOB|nr:hypothetical protein [Puniceibacterium sediminis]SNR64444.1 hypothetical protein SAMN06265370_1143 [Puniceibacterium sediminis]
MPNILVDTALLAVPNYAEVGADADELIDRVTHFAQLADPEVPVSMVLLNDVEAILWDNNAGPDFDAIEEFINLVGLADVYSPQDLFRQYTYILEASSRASEFFDTLVAECSEVTVTPELPSNLFPLNMRFETHRVLSQLCIKTLPDRLWLYGSSLRCEGILSFSVSTSINSVGEVGDDKPSPTLPLQLNDDIPVFHKIWDIVSLAMAERLWVEAQNAGDLALSITIGSLALLRTTNKDAKFSELKVFGVGSGFIDSLKANQCFGDGKFSGNAARMCMGIVAGLPFNSIQKMRISQKSSKQRVRAADKSLAYRTHITKGGVGLRLMFWESQQIIEFANIGPKLEEEIETGIASSRVYVSLGDLF